MPKSLKILVVEDEAMLALLLKVSLQKLGHTLCDPVATGEAAIACALSFCPDLILMDLRLIGPMNGVEAMQKIRESYYCEVIFMTGYSDTQWRRETDALNPLAYLVKPVTPDDLVDYLDQLG